jgi:hypothetical protein
LLRFPGAALFFTLRATGYGGSFFVACLIFHPQFSVALGSRSAARARASRK